jgi:glutamate formiminotransferase
MSRIERDFKCLNPESVGGELLIGGRNFLVACRCNLDEALLATGKEFTVDVKVLELGGGGGGGSDIFTGGGEVACEGV